MKEKKTIPERIAILGAGISGMSAAWYLMQKRPEVSFQVWESRSQVGGVIQTIEREGFQIEQGVDNFITTVPYGLDLCKELGLMEEVTGTNNQYRRTFVVRKGRLYPLPDGFLMMAPTKLWPLAITPLLSPWGKMRAGLELFLPRHKKQDESMADFVERRLGREVFERIVEPLVSGIYAGDAHRLSVWATLPQFPEMEVKYRSLILAMRARLREAHLIKKAEESGARYSFFVSLKHGLQLLPQTIADRLPKGSVCLNRKVVDIKRIEEEGRTVWLLTDQTGKTERYDALISALPASAVAAVFTQGAPEIANLYRQIELSGVAIVTLGFRQDQIKRPMSGMGYVVPEIEQAEIVAGSFSSHKYPHRAPKGTVLIRLFAGGTRTPDLVHRPDNEILNTALKELCPLLDIEGEPLVADLAHWPATMPQYNKGHLTWLEEIHREEQKYPTLALAGNALDGVGIPNCIKNAQLAVNKILSR